MEPGVLPADEPRSWRQAMCVSCGRSALAWRWPRRSKLRPTADCAAVAPTRHPQPRRAAVRASRRPDPALRREGAACSVASRIRVDDILGSWTDPLPWRLQGVIESFCDRTGQGPLRLRRFVAAADVGAAVWLVAGLSPPRSGMGLRRDHRRRSWRGESGVRPAVCSVSRRKSRAVGRPDARATVLGYYMVVVPLLAASSLAFYLKAGGSRP